MIVLHPTSKEQFDSINGYTNGTNILCFGKDGNDKWYVTLGALECSTWAEIHDQLDQLERIEYTPFPETE